MREKDGDNVRENEKEEEIVTQQARKREKEDIAGNLMCYRVRKRK